MRTPDVDPQIDTWAYSTSDRSAIRATTRITFAYPQAAALQKVTLNGQS